MARTGKSAVKRSTLRIIGGQWRGRKLAFTPAEGLRPTTDRVRETLFNWLAPLVHDARCLDLFAGSGALGLEALSRGARYCDFVDTSSAALLQIEHHLRTLQADQLARCHPMPASVFLQAAHEPYDIVFLDPPFGKNLLDPVCAALDSGQMVANGGLIYLETALRDPAPALPSTWRGHREKVAGEVCYRLLEQAG